MKKLIFGIIILIILIATLCVNLIYQRSVLKEMLDIIDTMSELPSEKSALSADRLNEIWKKNKTLFSFSTHVEELDNVESALLKLLAFANGGDVFFYNIALGETRIAIEAIESGDSFSFSGIF